MRARSIPLVVSLATLAAQALGVVSPVLAAAPVVVPFTFTGTEQVWAVPAGVTSINVVLVGGKGGTGDQAGGRGARVSGDLAVAPSTILYVEVGGNGDAIGSTAFNGGGTRGSSGSGFPGGGGGASDIRTVSNLAVGSLASRLMVAGGGGGGGIGTGEAGADAGSGAVGAGGGGAGLANAGGFGGAAINVGHSAGQPGQLGIGGDGAPSSWPGAGGGGGLYGGGGGGGGTSASGGGGGGSSSTGSASNPSVAIDNTGVPSITITYTAGPGPSPTPGPTPSGPPDNGTVVATVTMAQSVVCLQLSASAIDFGTRQFGDVGIAATPGVTVTNCGGIGEDVLAHGADATGAGATTWTLNDTGTCLGGTLPTNNFGLTVERQDTNAQVRLSTSSKSLETLTGGSAIDHLARIDTPCPGSAGAGVVMTMQITFVATEAVP